jgi:hypothetical protein
MEVSTLHILPDQEFILANIVDTRLASEVNLNLVDADTFNDCVKDIHS